ncbi:MAG: spermidine synthase [Campylobacterota bacterium]
MSNKNFNEMIVHVPLCTHKEPSNVLVIGSADEDLRNQVAKHNYTSNVEFGDKSLLASKNEKDIDVIIFTDVKPDELLLANIEKVLKDDGVISFATTPFFKNKEELKADLNLIGQKFWIAMPYRFGHETAILASKRYHPTADIILQRSDLLDDLEYYSTEIHSACFIFPACEHKELTGIARR